MNLRAPGPEKQSKGLKIDFQNRKNGGVGGMGGALFYPPRCALAAQPLGVKGHSCKVTSLQSPLVKLLFSNCTITPVHVQL